MDLIAVNSQISGTDFMDFTILLYQLLNSIKAGLIAKEGPKAVKAALESSEIERLTPVLQQNISVLLRCHLNALLHGSENHPRCFILIFKPEIFMILPIEYLIPEYFCYLGLNCTTNQQTVKYGSRTFTVTARKFVFKISNTPVTVIVSEPKDKFPYSGISICVMDLRLSLSITRTDSNGNNFAVKFNLFKDGKTTFQLWDAFKELNMFQILGYYYPQ